MEPDTSTDRLAEHTASIVSAFVARNNVASTELPGLISSVHAAMSGLNGSTVVAAVSETQKPAVSLKKSITPEYIICLEDGKKLKMLKRHLRATYNMSPDEYRTKWGLSADYPMTAPGYSARRSDFAKKIGLGTKGGRRKAVAPRAGTRRAAAAAK